MVGVYPILEPQLCEAKTMNDTLYSIKGTFIMSDVVAKTTCRGTYNRVLEATKATSKRLLE